VTSCGEIGEEAEIRRKFYHDFDWLKIGQNEKEDIVNSVMRATEKAIQKKIGRDK